MPAKLDISQSLYNTDYLQWIETTGENLRDRNYDRIDWENLIDEIEDIGRSERRSLESNLVVILSNSNTNQNLEADFFLRVKKV